METYLHAEQGNFDSFPNIYPIRSDLMYGQVYQSCLSRWSC